MRLGKNSSASSFEDMKQATPAPKLKSHKNGKNFEEMELEFKNCHHHHRTEVNDHAFNDRYKSK